MRAHDYSHPALTDFASIADTFCETVANVTSRTPAALLDQIHRLLPRVYSAALQLPDTTELFDDGDDSDELDPDEARFEIAPPAGLAHLADFLGSRRFYRAVYDPYAGPADGEVTGDIIDDLGDIYRDLQRGLLQWRDEKPGEARWEWRVNFQRHWGAHATSALRAIFALSAWHDIPWPSGTG